MCQFVHDVYGKPFGGVKPIRNVRILICPCLKVKQNFVDELLPTIYAKCTEKTTLCIIYIHTWTK